MSRISNLAGFTTSLSTTQDLSVGVVTASSFIGDLTGNVTGNLTGTASTATAAGTAYGLTGSPDITVGNVTGTAATFTGNVSIAGTLTYEDVTNVDSIGLITARSGIEVSGIITARAGYAVTFYGDGSGLTGLNIPASSDWRDSSLF